MTPEKETPIPSRPFSEKELMQKPRPTHVVLKRGSKVNTFKLSDYDKETQRPASTDRR